jgi:hypothetical protein
MAISPFDWPISCLLPADASHSNFRDGAEAQEAIREGQNNSRREE